MLVAACAAHAIDSPAPPTQLDAVSTGQTAAFDPHDLKARLPGKPTEVLVLANMHLSGTPESFDAAVLEPLPDRLAAFKRDHIAIENLSGESIQGLKIYEAVYPDSADYFGGRVLRGATMAQAELNLTLPQAEAEVLSMLRDWPESPAAAEGRRLAALFLTSGDPHSALVQWWRLKAEERVPGDGISAELIKFLGQYATRKSKSHLIGVHIAVRLGLERALPTDDHYTDDLMTVIRGDLTTFFDEIDIAAQIADPKNAPMMHAADFLNTPEEALQTCRVLNSPEAGMRDVALQWLVLFDQPTPNDAGRVRMAEWETRNLRMSAASTSFADGCR